MNATGTEDIVNRTVAAIRASKSAAYRRAAHEHPQQVVTLEELAAIVDAAFEEVSQALIEALGSEGQDEASAREWWGEPEPGPYDQFKGGLTEQGYLPRVPTASSWWDGCPEKPE